MHRPVTHLPLHLAVWLTLSVLHAGMAHGQASVTIITHGFSPDSKGPWVQGMAEAIAARVPNGHASIFRYTDATGAWTYVPTPGIDGSPEAMVLIFNWVPESDGAAAGPNWNYTQAAGDALYGLLRAPVFVGAPNPNLLPDDLTTDRKMHFIGHSRGACVNSEAVRRLAIAGIAVDQLTSLDPHPVNGTLDPPLNFNWGDPVPQVWSNVAWADNCWRADGGLLNALDFDGIPIVEAFNTQLNESALNCCAYSFAHSDVHLWYHGTIDVSPNPCDGEQCINATMRATWWPEGYTQRGFYYSYIGGGSAERPGPVPVGADPGDAPVLVNGDFEQGTYAGWLHHGGFVNGQIVQESGNGYLRLGPGAASSAQHNRFYLPLNAAELVLDYRVQTPAAGESLELSIVDVASGEVHAVGSIALDAARGWVFGHAIDLPSSAPRGRLCVLRAAITAPIGAIDAVVHLDNIHITLVPKVPGDVTGDGCVNVIDLLAVINAWGACPIGEPCPADVAPHPNGDGIVGVDDLLMVISAWQPCG